MDLAHVGSLLNHAWIVLLAIQMGLAASFGDIAAALGRGGLVLRTLAVNCLVVPLLAFVLLRLFDAGPYVSAGILTLVFFPGAVFGPTFTEVSKGDVPLSIGLMVMFCGVSLLVSPFLLHFLLGRLLHGDGVVIDVFRIMRLIFLAQILPLSLGLVVLRLRPRWAQKAAGPVKRLSSALGLAVCAVILWTRFSSLEVFGLRAVGGMILLFLLSLLAGLVIGGREPGPRRSVIMSCSGRNIALALITAAGNFSGTPAAAAVLAYALVSLFGSLVTAKIMGRTMEARSAESG